MWLYVHVVGCVYGYIFVWLCIWELCMCGSVCGYVSYVHVVTCVVMYVCSYVSVWLYVCGYVCMCYMRMCGYVYVVVCVIM